MMEKSGLELQEYEAKLIEKYREIFANSSEEERQEAVSDTLKKLKEDRTLRFYHGSRNKGIQELVPMAVGVRDLKEGSVVFTTNFKAVATMFVMGLRDGDKIMSFELLSGSKPFVIFRNKQLIVDNDNGGAIYECEPQGNDFYVNISKGFGINECVSKGKVAITKKEEFDYAIQAILDNGVDVYITDDEELFNYLEFLRISPKFILIAKEIVLDTRFDQFFADIKDNQEEIVKKIKDLKIIPIGRYIKSDIYTDKLIDSVAEIIANSTIEKGSMIVPEEIEKKYKDRSLYDALMRQIQNGESIEIEGKTFTLTRLEVRGYAMEQLKREIDACRKSGLEVSR